MRRPGRFLFVFCSLVALCSAYLAYAWRTLPDVGSLAKQNPTSTALIEQREEEALESGKKLRKRQKWVPLASVATSAIWAVILSEDASFYVHDGIDTREISAAAQKAWEEKKLGRGASTITQQLAKNLYLSTDRSLIRKLKEVVLARRLEEALPKKRILALYLNIIEWGDGVFGIEAAAEEHFGISASGLSPAQSAILASMLPAPRRWTPKSRSATLLKRSIKLVDRMVEAGRLTSEEASQARRDIESIAWTGHVRDSISPTEKDDEELEEDSL